MADLLHMLKEVRRTSQAYGWGLARYADALAKNGECFTNHEEVEKLQHNRDAAYFLLNEELKAILDTKESSHE